MQPLAVRAGEVGYGPGGTCAGRRCAAYGWLERDGQAAAALTSTPAAFGPETVYKLQVVGLDVKEQVDLVLASAFFH